MVEEVAPQLGVGAHIGGDADLIQLEGEQAHIHLQPQTGADADGAHDIEVEGIVGRNDVDGLVGGGPGLYPDGEVVQLLGGVLKVHADGHRQIGADHKAALDLPAEDVQERAAVVLKQLDVNDVDPCVVGVLHHFLIDRRQRIHRAVGSGHLRRLGVALHLVHDLFQLLRHGLIAVIVLGDDRRVKVDAGVVAHHERGVQGIVIAQKADLVPAGADALAKNDLFLELGADLDLDAADGDLERNVYAHAEAVALQMLQTLIQTHARPNIGRVKLHADAPAVRLHGHTGSGDNRLHRFHAACNRVRVGDRVQIIALQHDRRQIDRRLLGIAALAHLHGDLILDLRLLLLGQRDLAVLRVIDVQRVLDVFRRCGSVGDNVLTGRVVHRDCFDPAVFTDLSVIRRVIPCAILQESKEVAHIQTVRVHTGHRRRNVLLRDGNGGIIRVAVRVPAALNGQHVRQEQHILHVGHLIADPVSLDLRDLDIGHVARIGGNIIEIDIAPRDRKNIAHLQGLFARIGERAVLRVLRGNAVFVDLIQAVEHLLGKALGIANVDLVILHLGGQRRVFGLRLCRPDIQNTHRRALLHAVQHKFGGFVQQLDLIGLARFQRGGNGRVADGILHVHVAAGDVDEAQRPVVVGLGNGVHAGNAECKAARRNVGFGHIVGRFDALHFLARRHFGVQGHVARHRVADLRTIGQLCIIEPAKEDRSGLCRGRQLTDGGARLDARRRHRHAVDPELYIIIGFGDRAAACGAAARGTTGAAAARGLLLLRLLIAALLCAARLDAHALTLHARLGVPGLHGLVRALAERGSLGAGRLILGREIHAVAVEQTQRPQLEHCVLRPRGHLVKVRGLCRDGRIGLRHRVKGLKIAHEEDRHLLAGDLAVRRELPASSASGDTVLCRPLDKGRVPGPFRDVGEVRRAGVVRRLDARHAAEHRDEHRARHRAFRLEGRRAGPVKEAVGAGVQNRRLIPAAALDVGERVLRLCRRRARRLGLARCRLRKALHLVRQNIGGYERDDHAEDQQQADDPFLHAVSPF